MEKTSACALKLNGIIEGMNREYHIKNRIALEIKNL